jgi:hypothetical protein
MHVLVKYVAKHAWQHHAALTCPAQYNYSAEHAWERKQQLAIDETNDQARTLGVSTCIATPVLLYTFIDTYYFAILIRRQWQNIAEHTGHDRQYIDIFKNRKKVRKCYAKQFLTLLCLQKPRRSCTKPLWPDLSSPFRRSRHIGTASKTAFPLRSIFLLVFFLSSFFFLQNAFKQS